MQQQILRRFFSTKINGVYVDVYYEFISGLPRPNFQDAEIRIDSVWIEDYEVTPLIIDAWIKDLEIQAYEDAYGTI